MLGRSYWPMLAMLSLPYTGYAHAIPQLILCHSTYMYVSYLTSKGIILLQELESPLVGFGRSALAPRISGEASAPQPSASPTPKSLTL